MAVETFKYDNRIVKNFALATIIWGIVGMLVGVIIATQLFSPDANLGVQYLTFGRLRPLHTNAVIFAFVGNGIFMGVYYSLQRLCKARMFSDLLSNIHFWGWQLIIVAAAISLPMGFTTSKEYAELEWPIDIAITLIWVIFGANMIGTIIKRRERHMYVAIWFYLATFVTVAILHLVNSFEFPITMMKSYSWYAGVQDALVQWWYGHNAVAFFLTTPYLGLMYYFLPKAVNRPVYSYRLSIIHFWSLIFIYIWAGPHHLLYTSLPDWAQSLGVAFSIMLIAPSWGGMINGLLTLRGAWDKVSREPVLKFMVVAITGYGMATLEGPMLSLKNLNAISHFTDWIVAHVHLGALSWNGFMTFAVLYWLVPKLFKTKLYSTKLANAHFWIGTLGILIYVIPMYWAGFTQGSMWKQFNETGQLVYGNFLDTTIQILPLHMMRAFGGLIYLIGACLMAYNLFKTMAQGKFEPEEEASAPALEPLPKNVKGHHWHTVIERKPMRMIIFAAIVVAIGGAVEMIPTFVIDSNIPTIASVKPLTPLELQGRDLYIREGCVGCHSQMIRPFRSETVRYKGEYSKAGEFVYDHPFLWGSKRTGPDLAREGGAKNNEWHYKHLDNPVYTSDKSIMPRYSWLLDQDLDNSSLEAKISALRTLGVPYQEGYEQIALADLEAQAKLIADDIRQGQDQIDADPKKEIIAIIAYLQRLGTDINTDK